jgi:phosphatidylserine/phosphatidylglycerophosphate/cardiolipin synthase-like enzyme
LNIITLQKSTTTMMKKIVLLTLLLWLSINASTAQTPIPIAQARLVPVGDTVTIRGIILNGSEIGIIRYIQDPTGGLALYDGSMTYMLRGDSVQVTGVMTSYNQLLELVSVTNDTVFSSGNPLPLPMVITPSQFGEIHESVMIRMNDVTFSNPGGTFSGNTNYNITSGGQQAQIRITNGSPLVGQLIPTSMMDVVGIGSQFSYSNPAAGYQMLLRDQQDIISNLSISLTSPVVVSGITTTSFDLAWTTNIQGTTEAFYGLTPSLGSHATTPSGSTNHSLSITGANPADIIYVKAFSVANGDTAFAGLNVYATQSLSSGAMKVYFTSTVDNTFSTGVNAIQLDDLMDDTLIAYINRAHQTIDLAVYNFNTQNISNIAAALNNASNRGVQVRVVYDGTTANLGIQSLYASIGKISSPTTSEYGIMHNKFIVIDAFHSNPDSAIVWMGSMNWTETCINQFANNVVIIQDQSLAKAYTLEFEEMFGSTGVLPNPANAKFGPYKTNNTPHEFVIGGKRVKSFFSPSDGVNAQIINHIEAAQHQVYVNTMLITRSDISYALRDKSIAGKDVKVIVNNDGDCTQLVVDVLTDQLGAYFKEFGESYTLHHKLMIVDPGYPGSNPFVWTGSHNWSNAADQRNDENTLVIYDSTIANIYLQEFQQRWSLGVPLEIPALQASGQSMHVFPNPSSGRFRIALEAPHAGNGTLQIFGTDGRLVHETPIQIVQGSQEVNINTTLHPGLYLLKLATPDGSITKRLVIR